jgi:hypothetical protein
LDFTDFGIVPIATDRDVRTLHFQII